MTQPQVLNETSPFSQKSREFYQTLVDLYGRNRAVEAASNLLYYGKETETRIHELAVTAIYEKATAQAGLSDPPKPSRGVDGRFISPIEATNNTVRGFATLARIWQELREASHRSRIDTANLVREEIARSIILFGP